MRIRHGRGRLGRALAVAGVVSLLACGYAAADPKIITVVTPGTPARWSAAAGGLMQLFDPFGDEDKAARLRRMAKEDRFEPGKRLQQHLLEALASRGQVALPLDLVRPAELVPAPLARDRLPATPLPGYVVDSSLEWFGVYRKGLTDAFRPMVAVNFRVLGPKGELLSSTRRLFYNVPSGSHAAGGETLAPDDDCQWKSFDEIPRERQRLWGCLDAALEKLAERVGDQVAGTR